MKFFKFLLVILCMAILVLGSMLAYNLDMLPQLAKCVDNTAAKLADTAPDIPESTETQSSVSVSTETKPVSSTEMTEVPPKEKLTEEECRERTISLINNLSVNAGDSDLMEEAYSLLSDLEYSESEYQDLLSAILAYKEGKGNSDVLIASLYDSNSKTAKQAAVSCWAAEQMKSDRAVFSFAGDCTFACFNEQSKAGGFPAVYEKSGSITYPFDNVRGVFSADDMTIINFEGTLTESRSHADKQFYFRGKPEYAKILSGSSVECATLANNHSLDYYEKGFEDTVKNLDAESISSFWASEPCVTTLRTDGGNVSVVMLATSSIDIENQSKFTALKAQIKKYKSPGTIVAVNLHWGVERAVKPSEWQIETAHELVDAGADLIIGHHPHILQGIEKYNGVYIAYSLGNFAFGGNSRANYPESMILRACFDIEGGEVGECTISAVPCYITSSGNSKNDYKASLQYGKKGQNVIDLILERSAMLPYGIDELAWHGIN